MSGFVAILNGEGHPLDCSLLQQMTDLMVFRGPDAQNIWSESYVGLGHALLRTTWESEQEWQPHSLNGTVWLTGDIRLDRRQGVIDQLRQAGCMVKPEAADVELVLQAYQVWQENCLDRLSGDFAFALWDGPRQRLFCARDQFGVVPLYYATVGNGVIVSNHLNCLRLHSHVSDYLNEQAIADLLLFSMNMDRSSTTFADIQRLPPAHTLIWSAGKVRIQQYWQLPEQVEMLHYKDPREYIEHFRELFDRSVADRLRTGQVGTHLSGGMDSTSIAATAHGLLKTTCGFKVDLRAYAIVYDHLIEEDEGTYAAQVAQQAGVPLEYLIAEDFIEQAPPEKPDYRYPEPLLIPTQVAEVEIIRRVATYGRVLLQGFGGDPALYPVPINLSQLLQYQYFIPNLLGCMGTLRSKLHLRTRLNRWLGRDQTMVLPGWFNPDFAKRTDLAARLQEQLTISRQLERYGMAAEPLWSNIFGWSDPGFSGFPVKSRFPFFDLHLVLFLLSVPPVPWFQSKFLLREAMQGRLPDSVRQRPKTPLGESPHYKLMQQRGIQPWMTELIHTTALTPYIKSEQLLQTLQKPETLTSLGYNQASSVLQLAYWLCHS
ncbi:asparagine synthase-related protein [Leptothoe sp. ISB3NOV94-8A]